MEEPKKIFKDEAAFLRLTILIFILTTTVIFAEPAIENLKIMFRWFLLKIL